MLNYLSEINSPLYQFLCYNPRVNELTSTNPYPKIKTYVLSLYDSPLTYLGDQPIPLSTKMTSLMLSNNLIYAFVPAGSDIAEKFYIGSRIAGTNRNVEHLATVRRKIRNNGNSRSSASSLVEFVLKSGGWDNMLMVILLQEPSFKQKRVY